MRTLVLCGVLVGLSGLARAQSLEGATLPDAAILARFGGAKPTAPGEIPDFIGISNMNNLTQGDIRLVTPYFEWVLQAPLSIEDKNQLRRRLIAEWTRPGSDLPRIVTVRSPWSFIKGAGSFDRAMFSDSSKSDDVRRLRNQKQIVAQMRALPGNADAQWILARYRAARRPLAPGTPALTQPIADMMAASTVFALNEVANRKIATDSPPFRAALTKTLAAQWPKMSVAQRQKITAIPTHWPAFKSFYWPGAPASAKERLRVAWGRELSPSFSAIRAVAARRAKAWAQIEKRQRAAWARLSSAEREQMISGAIAQNAATSRANIAAISQMQMVQHATNMNIINNMRSSPGNINYYYTR